VRLLFVKWALGWPRAMGHDVHTYYTMRSCAALGHEVSLAVANEPKPQALEGLNLRALYRFDQPNGRTGGGHVSSTWLQRKFRSFFGVSEEQLAALAHAAQCSQADAVIMSGLNVLPYFAAVERATSVWYAADELAWHHLSQLKLGDPSFIANVRAAAVWLVYERAHRRLVDRAWVVSRTERRAMRWLAGIKTVDVVALGIDGAYYTPGEEQVQPYSAVFWGRLDFGPNIQALEWFINEVWPLARQRAPNAQFTVIGFNPSDAVRRTVTAPGVALMPDVPDLRGIARQHAVAVFPFVSGGGTKNKLLEAAALGLPIVCTPTATLGLRGDAMPLRVVTDPASFAGALTTMWSDPDAARTRGRETRAWVLREHTWDATARTALCTLEPRKERS
jgi:glycosyltransferase involved in cell wall biosynthesis